MPKRALIEHRPWLLASVAAAIAFYFLRDNPIGGLWLTLLKGAGVGLLAAYAIQRARGTDGMLIAGVMGVSALADMAMELTDPQGGAPDSWLIAAGSMFALAHVIAVVLYLRNRRPRTAFSQTLLAGTLFVAAPAITWLLSRSVEITVYAAFLGTMAAAAWTSRFPRYRVGIGAVLFVISDWLIFSRLGTFDLGVLPDLLIWPLYYAGQLMIATGVVQTLRGEKVES